MLLAGLSSVGMPAAAQEDPPPLFDQTPLIRRGPIRVEVPAVRFGAAAWGDYDGDGDLDLFITGSVRDFPQPVPFSQLFLYRGHRLDEVLDVDDLDAGLGVRLVPTPIYEDAFSEDLPILEDVWRGAVAWGDYDNDGDLDVLATGVTASGDYTTHLYENLGNVNPGNPERLARRFSWPGVRDGAVAWGDYDNDGDLDFIISGTSQNGQALTALYENQGRIDGGFVRRDDANLVDLQFSSWAWGDYDNDGDLDLLATGVAAPQTIVTRLYRNEGNGTFTDARIGLKRLLFASVAWGDYDADGDLDILISGARLHPFILDGEIKIYENTGSGFVGDTVIFDRAFEADLTLGGRFQGSAGWGDYNNDGYLDFFVSGIQQPNDAAMAWVFRYAGGNHFTNVPGGSHRPGRFAGGLFGSTFWGDYDNDGDLDLFVLGDQQGSGVRLVSLRNYLSCEVTRVFPHCGVFSPNTPPDAPGGLEATPQGNRVTLSWDAAKDAQTPSPGLSYNLYVGATPGGVDVVSPSADPATGQRLLSALGNVGHNLRWTLKNLSPGAYYWSVQAIDTSYKGSPFAPEGTFTIP